MKELSILDFAVCISLLFHLGDSSNEIGNFAKRVRSRVQIEYRPLVDLCIKSKDKREFVRNFLTNY